MKLSETLKNPLFKQIFKTKKYLSEKTECSVDTASAGFSICLPPLTSVKIPRVKKK